LLLVPVPTVPTEAASSCTEGAKSSAPISLLCTEVAALYVEAVLVLDNNDFALSLLLLAPKLIGTIVARGASSCSNSSSSGRRKLPPNVFRWLGDPAVVVPPPPAVAAKDALLRLLARTSGA
jgi:hypothetical protein